MTDKELRKLTRPELLDELYNYAKVNADLQLKLENTAEELRISRKQSQAEKEELQRQIAAEKRISEDLSVRLRARKIEIANAGNIAEATMKVTGLFEQAQRTADLYLQNIQSLTEKQERELAELDRKTREDIQRLGDEATRTCTAMRIQTEEECAALREKTESDCKRMREEAYRQAEEYWLNLSQRLEDFYEAHKGMQELFAGTTLPIPGYRGPKVNG